MTDDNLVSVKIHIDISDITEDKNYKVDWAFTENALTEYKSKGLSRERQITSLIKKMLQSEPAIHLFEQR